MSPPDVLLSPHTAGLSVRENKRIVDLFCQNLRRSLAFDELRAESIRTCSTDQDAWTFFKSRMGNIVTSEHQATVSRSYDKRARRRATGTGRPHLAGWLEQENADLYEWCRDCAPSTGLRK